MKYLFAGLIDENTIKAVGWTLVHSLWQGLLLALIAAIIISVTRKSRPIVRYNLLAFLFFGFLVVSAGTFINELNVAESSQPPLITAIETGEHTFSPVPDKSNAYTQPANISLAQRISIYFDRYAVIIVGLWFLLFIIRLVRTVIDMRNLQYIRHHGTSEPSDYWKNRLQELMQALQLKKAVRFLQSEIVKVPMVIGFFKPVLLIPMGMLTQLDPQQLEAILLHELAHVKRRDYLVNLVQHFVETIFFFNPALLWVSSLLKDERENCCDDLAISEIKDKKQFVRALVAFQEYHLASSQYAMGFPGRKDHLLSRVQRIIYKNNKTLSAMEKIILTACCMIVFVVITLLSYSQKTKADKVVSKEEKVVTTDTIPKKPETFPMENGVTISGNTITYYGRGYKIVTDSRSDKITELFYKGERIPQDKMASHTDTAEKVIKEQRELFEKQAEKGTKPDKANNNNNRAENKTQEQNNNNKTADPEDKVDPPADKAGSENYIRIKKTDSSGRPNPNAIDPATVPYGYKITEGDTIRYFLREYEIVTENGKKVVAMYHKGQKIPDAQLSSYNEMAQQMITEVQDGINKRVKEWRKRHQQ